MHLIDIYRYRTFHPKAEECTFFMAAHGTFSRIDHMLGHKTRLNNFKKIKVTSSIFSSHNGMKLEIDHKGKNWKNHKNMEIRQHATE